MLQDGSYAFFETDSEKEEPRERGASKGSEAEITYSCLESPMDRALESIGSPRIGLD